MIDTVDYLDPQQAYTGQAWWAMYDVYETLLTYRHVDGAAGYKLVPGLAQSMPTVSGHGKVYKFTLRKGLKYSDGSPVLASDFKWAIKRGFLATGQGVDLPERQGQELHALIPLELELTFLVQQDDLPGWELLDAVLCAACLDEAATGGADSLWVLAARF